MEKNDQGMVAIGSGWFTVNVRDAAWGHNDRMGDACLFERDWNQFEQIGYTLAVLQPG